MYVHHTPEHSKWNRCQIFSYNIRFGKASFWFTFNPTTQNHKIMVFFATGVQYEVPPPAFDRYKQLADFPGAQALFFSKFLQSVLTHVLGWCHKKHSPYTRLGMFPLVNAWTYAIENDSAQTLHCHMMVWCLGDANIKEKLNYHSLCNVHQSKKKRHSLQKIPCPTKSVHMSDISSVPMVFLR